MTSYINLKKVLIILFILLSSCSTLVNKNQIIGIDTKPSGLTVYTEDKEGPLGKTPNYFLLDRRKQHKFKIIYKGKEKEFTEVCQTQWNNFGNFALTINQKHTYQRLILIYQKTVP